MYLLSLLVDLEAIVHVPAFSAGGPGSNCTRTCLFCWRTWRQLYTYLPFLLEDLEAIIHIPAFLLEDLEATVYVPALSATEASNIKSRLYSLLKEGG